MVKIHYNSIKSNKKSNRIKLTLVRVFYVVLNVMYSYWCCVRYMKPKCAKNEVYSFWNVFFFLFSLNFRIYFVRLSWFQLSDVVVSLEDFYTDYFLSFPFFICSSQREIFFWKVKKQKRAWKPSWSNVIS